jgi:peptide/nickel transport system substrate-binding protein
MSMRVLPSVAMWLVAMLALQACSSERAPSASKVQPSELTVLLQTDGAGAWPAGLDPATNSTGGANLTIMNAIFGGLFQLTADPGGGDPKLIPNLALGYEFSDDAKTLVIQLREGIQFSDGTPLDAEAVRFNIERNLAAPCSCAPVRWPWVTTDRVTVLSPTRVALHFSRPYPSALNAWPVSNVNWIASPTAIRTMSEEAFRLAPVGAGPFKVRENILSSRLVLEKNSLYWQKDRPLLDLLTFKSIGGEQSAYLALLAGDGDAAEGVTSVQLIKRAQDEGKLQVVLQPSTSVYWVQLNTTSAPFNDKRLREAIYYATDVESLRMGLVGGQYPASQSFTASGGLFYNSKVPGYRSFDLSRARALVNAIGHVEVSLSTVRDPFPERMAQALKTQWESAGMHVTVQSNDLAVIQTNYRNGQWQASLQRAGSFDPDAGLMRRFRSDQVYSGIKDKRVDELLDLGGSTVDPKGRADVYLQLAKHVSDQAYGPFLFEVTLAQFARKDVRGPGLTSRIPPVLTSTGIHWQDVHRSSQ